MSDATAPLAVLAGDLIRSGDLSDAALARAFQTLEAQADAVSRWAGGALSFTRNRGDGWQVALHRPTLDLRAALSFCATLTALGPGFATRIALARGMGTIHGPDLNRASGPVFVAAGQALDRMTAPTRLVHADGGALSAAVRLADAVAQGWTPTQARTIAPMFAPDPPTHATIATQLGVSRQAVSKALDAAHYDVLSEALALIEETP